jgi:hypothetical protein
MLTRDEAAARSSAALLAAVGIFPDADLSSEEIGEADRELRLSISDGFTRQVWIEAGRRWTETRDTLTFHQDERVRLTVTNDRPGARVVAVGGRPAMRLREGETRSLVMGISSDNFDISVMDQPMIARPVKVRPDAAA